MKLETRSRTRLTLLSVALSLALAACAHDGPVVPADRPANAQATRIVPVPAPINDPLEPMNRVLYSVNENFVHWIVDPVAAVYGFILGETARRHVAQAGHNLAYPVRLINTLLQGRFNGAANETGRFAVNTTVGLLGLFDPATKMGIPQDDADFGQTLKSYGMTPGYFLFVPLIGPSSSRDIVGAAADMAADPASWIPVVDPALSFNKMSLTDDMYDYLREAGMDPYVQVRDAWMRSRMAKLQPAPPVDSVSSPTEDLKILYFAPQNGDFIRLSESRRARIAASSRRIPYSLWMREERSPLIYLIPGLGAHRWAETTVATAEMYYDAGFSVVAISSPFNWEFIQDAAAAPLPGYLPADARDLEAAFQAIDADVEAAHPGRFSSRGLLGLSFGGQEALAVAASQKDQPGAGGPVWSRVAAIDPPVDTIAAFQHCDSLYESALKWPADERLERTRNALLKLSALNEDDITSRTLLPFGKVESDFLVGYDFRQSLKEAIFSSQRKRDLGILKLSPDSFVHDAVYQEIERYAFRDYLSDFLVPYYTQDKTELLKRADVLANSSLRSLGEALKDDPAVRVCLDRDDGFLSRVDAEWLHSLLGDRAMILDRGGCLGNLYLQDFQQRLIALFEDLKVPA